MRRFVLGLESALKRGRRALATFLSKPSHPASPKMPDRESDRFECITLPVEWVEAYKPGGFHPTNLGDVFNNGQYRVIRKLGVGAFSTVWLADDLT